MLTLRPATQVGAANGNGEGGDSDALYVVLDNGVYVDAATLEDSEGGGEVPLTHQCARRLSPPRCIAGRFESQ